MKSAHAKTRTKPGRKRRKKRGKRLGVNGADVIEIAFDEALRFLSTMIESQRASVACLPVACARHLPAGIEATIRWRLANQRTVKELREQLAPKEIAALADSSQRLLFDAAESIVSGVGDKARTRTQLRNYRSLDKSLAVDRDAIDPSDKKTPEIDATGKRLEELETRLTKLLKDEERCALSLGFVPNSAKRYTKAFDERGRYQAAVERELKKLGQEHAISCDDREAYRSEKKKRSAIAGHLAVDERTVRRLEKASREED